MGCLTDTLSQNKQAKNQKTSKKKGGSSPSQNASPHPSVPENRDTPAEDCGGGGGGVGGVGLNCLSGKEKVGSLTSPHGSLGTEPLRTQVMIVTAVQRSFLLHSPVSDLLHPLNPKALISFPTA